MADIFFTYAPEDAARAGEIAKALEAQGLTVDWTREILPGQNRVTEMTRRLSEARAVVVLWSSRSIAAPMVLDEAGAARDQGKLVPVMVDRIEPPLGFRQLHTSDLTSLGSAGATEQLALLAQALKGREAAPMTTQAQPPRATWGGGTAAPVSAGGVDERKFLWTRRFWSGTGILGLIIGLVWFLTPDSASEMGVDKAERTGYMIGVVIGATLFVIVGRALIHLSRKLVGKGTGAYFNTEYNIILVLGLLFGVMVANTPDQPGQESGFVADLMSGLVAFPVLAGIALLVVRGVLRMMRGSKAA